MPCLAFPLSDGHEENPPLLDVFLRDRTVAERCIVVGWSKSQYERIALQRLSEFTDRFSGRSQCHERTIEELISKSGAISIHHTVSLQTKHGSPESTQQPVRRSAARASSLDPCPSLESDHSSVDNGPAPQHQNMSSVTSEAQIPQPEAAGPSIFSVIRQILAHDPLYAEDVVSGVQNLPIDGRDILVPPEDECVDGSTNNPPRTSNTPSNKRQRSKGKSTGVDSGSGTGGGQQGEHLVKHHSQKVKSSNRNREAPARFYMTELQQTLIQQAAEKYTKRPRDVTKWLDYWKKLFVEVWWILFLKADFPHFNEPLSPFHIDSGESPNLGQHVLEKAEILLVGPILEGKAKKAVRNNVIASVQDFKPTAEDIEAMMSEAITVALLNSPAATGAAQWWVRASPEMFGNAKRKDGRALADDEDESENGDDSDSESDDNRPSTPSDSVTAPRTPEPAEVNPKQAPPPAQQTIVPLRLFPWGTRVTVDLFPVNPLHSETQAGQLTHPPTVYIASMSQTPVQPPPSLMPITDTFDEDVLDSMVDIDATMPA
ncbi:hypothetical protein EDB82DRAFT_555019 [Fusarium venenatum]|uniref:uncharacterized protein n=1 Tax=Fusarium venenatum TaxID=56646 RepID=UPI001D8F9B27|nr:hypothetical protein EDB82DRAFT_555019 [Fusarium venenatum]